MTLRRVERVRDVYTALLATRHNGFPVEEGGEARLKCLFFVVFVVLVGMAGCVGVKGVPA